MTEVGSPGEHGAQQRDDFSEKLLFLVDFFFYAHQRNRSDISHHREPGRNRCTITRKLGSTTKIRHPPFLKWAVFQISDILALLIKGKNLNASNS